MLQDYLSEIASAPLVWMIFLGLAGIVVWHLLSAGRANLGRTDCLLYCHDRRPCPGWDLSQPSDLRQLTWVYAVETIADLGHEKCEGPH
ncbi:hypothetical protein [Rhizobium gallicum]|uniref:hypothetical protein n=1 Tax=Rhizobium gallicum TaxID=56730 RepID=UPI0012EC61AA|nr:hypothetical protein [Rhizobium gallicum]